VKEKRAKGFQGFFIAGFKGRQTRRGFLFLFPLPCSLLQASVCMFMKKYLETGEQEIE